jgi:hypothetical protein
LHLFYGFEFHRTGAGDAYDGVPDAVGEDQAHPQQDGEDRQAPRDEVAVEGPVLSL